MTNEVRSAVYVLDTHALYWYWWAPARLGSGADLVFRALEQSQAIGFVPVLVVTELHYLLRRTGGTISVETILQLIDRAPALRLEALTRRHLLACDQLGSIPEMHDRLIAGAGLIHGAPIVTRDPAIQACPLVRAVW